MRRLLSILLAGCCVIAVAACEQTTPEQYFARAVLNSNLLYGFAGSGMQRQLASPSVKLTDAKTGASAPMKRAEVLKDKLDSLQSNFEKVKALSNKDDTKEMIKASLALYEFALPVYRNEYQALAALYDSGAAAEKIAALEKSIADKYAAKFQALHRELITAGKVYAAKHNIKVREVNPEPRR
jgi:uncharacterized lipoprotein YehR (DUF1307 family)